MSKERTNTADFVQHVKDLLGKGAVSRLQVEKIAKTQYGIENAIEVKELTELAIVYQARYLSANAKNADDGLRKITELYHRQPHLSLRTSNTISMQQYSTPAPVAYLMGLYCGIDAKENGMYLEPSAGNGMLTIAAHTPYRFTVNELDDLRVKNLKTQGFWEVTQLDALSDALSRKLIFGSFDAVLANPPFGPLPEDKWVNIFGYLIKDLDHYMILRALIFMEEYGKAALIIGGHTEWDEQGRVQAGKNRVFLNLLYKYYIVDDIVLMDNSFFAKMGTTFPTRLILISGRQPTHTYNTPLKTEKAATVVRTFEELKRRIDYLAIPKKLLELYPLLQKI